jgi:integral membrane protein
VKIDYRYLRRLRLLGTIEGISTLILFGVAMPLKYAADTPLAVTIAGSIHGFLFIALVSVFVRGIDRIPISRRLAAAGVVGAVFPFGPFVVDRWLGHTSSTAAGRSPGSAVRGRGRREH